MQKPITLAFAFLLTVGCGEEKGTDIAEPVAGTPPSFAISPESLQLAVGASGEFKTSFVSWSYDTSLVWTVANGSIASVSQSGRVTALRPGRVQIVVYPTAVPSLRASRSITVLP